MKFMENWKRFWTLNRHHAEGFTLVELIVVIAILAILAGVAVPAYSGYVAQANKVADEQLLDALNTAFASACAINGEDHYGRDDVSIKMEAVEGGKEVEVTVSGIEGFAEAFGNFYEGGVFKVFTDLTYYPEKGAFGEGVTVTVGGHKIAVSKELADALKDNTFSDLGAELLTGKVDKISDIAAALINHEDGEGNRTLFYEMVNSEEYLMELMNSLNMDETEFQNYIMNEDGTFKADILANSLVLSAAQKTEGMDTNFLGTAGSAAQLRSELDNPATATDAMAKLALTYGMYTAYVQTNPDMEDRSEELLEQGTFTGMTDILKDIESEGFQNYLASEKGQADLEAYLASMQIVNDSANQSADATKDILTNGFTDPDLVDALNSLMGKQ